MGELTVLSYQPTDSDLQDANPYSDAVSSLLMQFMLML